MMLVGQWILFGVVVLLGIYLLWNAAQCVVKLAVVIVLTVLVLLGLHKYALLPEPIQVYVDELCSTENVQKAEDWLHHPSLPNEGGTGAQNPEQNGAK